MKYQVFFLSLFCFVVSSSAMEKSVRGSLENSKVVADQLEQYTNNLYCFNPFIDLQNLANYIEGVRQSPMTKLEREKALVGVRSQRLALIDAQRRARRELNEGIYREMDEPSEKRRKIN